MLGIYKTTEFHHSSFEQIESGGTQKKILCCCQTETCLCNGGGNLVLFFLEMTWLSRPSLGMSPEQEADVPHCHRFAQTCSIGGWTLPKEKSLNIKNFKHLDWMKSQSRRQRYVNMTLLQLSGKFKSWRCQPASMSFINVPEHCPVIVHTQSLSPPWCCPYLLEFLALSDRDKATLMRLPYTAENFEILETQ